MSEAPDAKHDSPEQVNTGPEQVKTNPEPKLLKSTLNLPQTAFPMKAGLPVNEPLRLAAWDSAGLYDQIRALRQRCHPPRPRAQQNSQRFRRQNENYGRV